MSENEKNEQNEYAPLKGIKIVDWTQVQSSPIRSIMYSTFSLARC